MLFPRFKEKISVGQLQLNFLFDGENTNGTLVQFELIVPSNAKVPAPHFHVSVDEALYVLQGTLTMTIGEETRIFYPGDSIFIKRGTVHGFVNVHPETVHALCTLSPASIGPAYFHELAALINAGGPPDMQKIVSVMKKHGLEPVKPS